MRQARQNQTLQPLVEKQSRFRPRSRRNSSRGGGGGAGGGDNNIRPPQFSVASSVDYSLEHMDALSRLANAVAATGLGTKDSFSLDRSNPFDLYSPTLAAGGGGGRNGGEMDALLDNINTLAEQEEQRRAEVVEALGVARRVLKGLESQQSALLSSGMPSRYGLMQRRGHPTEEHSGGDRENDDTPNAARRYASFMRNEALGQSPWSSSSEAGGGVGGTQDQGGMKGSPAKMIALLTRSLRMCPDILSELEFDNVVNV
jgi:hypothetical protein